MSGHSKWATIKRAKAVTDAKRGAIFTKIANIITIAAREKGGDPNANPSLRIAIDKARSVNMPKDNIERAIKKGTGELAGDIVEELYYEAVLPGNIQFVVKCLTDNKNRSASTVRHLFSKNGGSFAAVLWNFEQKGVISLDLGILKEKNTNLDELQMELIDLEIDDFIVKEDFLLVISKVEKIQQVKNFLEEKGFQIESAEIEYIAKDKQDLADEYKDKIEKFIDDLDDIEDVSDYYNNLNL